jgi:hypothetical protein
LALPQPGVSIIRAAPHLSPGREAPRRNTYKDSESRVVYPTDHWRLAKRRSLGRGVVAALDIVWHLVFTRQVVVTAVGVVQMLLGFGISALIVQRTHGWNDFWLAVFLVIGTLILGAAATWIVMNLIAILYNGLSNLIPDLKTRAGAGIAIILTAECKAFALALKHLAVDRPAKTLADKAAKLIQRYPS